MTSKRKISKTQNTSLGSTTVKTDVFKVANIAPVVLKEDVLKERTEEQTALSSEDMLPFFDFYNEFYSILADAKRTSPTHSCIVKQKTRMSVGSGFNLSLQKPSLFQRAKAQPPTESDFDKIDSLLLSVNAKNESLLKVCEKAYNSVYTFGNAYIQIAKIKSSGTVSYKIVNLNTKKVLLKKHNKDGVIDSVLISNNFYDKSAKVTTVPLFPVFAKIKDRGNVEYSVLHLKTEDAEFDNYGIPDIVPALLSAGLEYRIPKFNNMLFSNGFMPSAFIQIIGKFTEQEGNALVKKIENKFTGDGQTSKMFIQATTDKDAKAMVQLMDKQKEGSFLELDDMCMQKIVTAHNWSQALVGIKRAGSLGSNQDILTEYLIAYENCIKPMQQYFSDTLVNPILKLMLGEQSGVNYSLSFSNSIPTSFLGGKIDLSKILEEDELRDILGYAPKLKNADKNGKN